MTSGRWAWIRIHGLSNRRRSANHYEFGC